MNDLIYSSIMGFIIGDAMGVPLEFKKRSDLLRKVTTTMIGYGTHDMPAGTWSDDTSMTLATIQSIIDLKKIDEEDIMMNFRKWVEKNDFTPHGLLFDIGRTCLHGIKNFSRGNCKAKDAGGKGYMSNGNGSLMRILPIALYIHKNNIKNPNMLMLVSHISSMTHAHEISILGCYLYVQYIVNLLNTKDKFKALRHIQKLSLDTFSGEHVEVYKRILKGNLKELSLNEISSSGYVVDTLEAVLWVVLNTTNFKQAIIGAINLGEDSDTIGAITGSIAGILYGKNELPIEWLEKLARKKYLEKMIEDFIYVLNVTML